MVYREVFTEVSGTIPHVRDTEVHELDKRHKCVDEQAQLCEVQRIQKLIYVDSAGIDGKLFALPREITPITG